MMSESEINLVEIEQEALSWKDVALEQSLNRMKAAVDIASDLILRKYSFRTMLDTEELWVYDAGCYKPIGEAIIKDIVQRQPPIKDRVSTHFVNEIINSVKRKTYIERKDFEAPLHLICVKNGVFNLQTGLLEKHSPHYFFKNKVPHDYNENATCPAIKEFLRGTIEPKYFATSLEVLAFPLYRHYFVQKAVMLTGTGRNGKSIFLDLMTTLHGGDNISHEQLQGLCHSQFSSAELYGKVANICGDLPNVILEDTGNFKILVSGLAGDTISAQKKFQNPFAFLNAAKLIFSANEIPETKDQTEAFFRRWLIIEFPFTFVSGLKDEEYVGDIKREDRDLIQKLTTKEEMEGLLKESLACLRELLKTREFTHSPSSKEIRAKYNIKSNSAVVFNDLFIDDVLEQQADEEEPYVIKEFLYQEYLAFCAHHRVHFRTPEAFFKLIKDRWAPTTEKKTTELGVRKNVYLGIRYRDWRENLEKGAV